MGGFLVALAALGAFVLSRGPDGPSHHYVVAARDVAPGSVLTAADLTTAAVDLPDGLVERAFADTAVVSGRLAVAPLARGELVQAAAVASPDASGHQVELSVPVDRARALDGLVQPGEHVDVLATYGTGADGATLVVARAAEVRRIDGGQRSALGTPADTVILLAVGSTDEAMAVTHGSLAGKLTLVRAGDPTATTTSTYRPTTGSTGH